MKRQVLSLLIAASTILSTSRVAARMVSPESDYTRPTSSKAEPKGNAVDFQTFELDGEVKHILWCGNKDEIILLHSTDGYVYRSRDRGESWKKLKNIIMKQGTAVADQNQDIGSVHRIQQSPVDDQLVVFIGTQGINWVSDDCGANIRALNSGKKIHEFMFHPTQRSWALAASWTNCAEFVDEPCRIYKELYYTKDAGEEWNYVTNYVFDFEWGTSPIAAKNGISIPDQRVFVTRDESNTKHQITTKKVHWNNEVNLYVSDDFFATSPTMALERGNTIIKTPQYMFVSQAHDDQVRVGIYSSTFRSGFTDVKKARMPRDAMSTTTFTLMDTSEDQVFLYVENKGQKTPFGTLYISDEGARSFSHSLTNVIKGNAVDFERVTSLDGTFIANKYVPREGETARIREKRHEKTLNAIAERDFGEDDMIAEERKKASRSRMSMSNNINRKQAEVDLESGMADMGVPAKEVEQHVKTFITHNKGGKWELIKAPEKHGNQLSNCYLEDGCSLHLEIYSHQGLFAPVYSTENAVGIVLATGNTGQRLTENNNIKNLYLSRDGGLNWRSIRRGNFIYEIGDHGALIVIAKKLQEVNYIEFSWDEGDTWEKLIISDKNLEIENIIIEPNSMSQEFMIYGVYAGDSDEEIEYMEENPVYDIEGEAFLIYVDFSQLHEPQCRGVDNAGAPDSDYETWTPHDGRFGDNKCFLGMHKTYVRRKQSALCYNGEEYETVTHIEPCTCSDLDYECDNGYIRSDEMGGQCVLVESELTDEELRVEELARQNQQCQEYGYYEISRGYRKIPGNICSGGVDLVPYRYQCSGAGRFFQIFSFRNLLIISGIAAIVYYGWPMIEAMLLLLPIPDPTEAKEKMTELGSQAMNMVKGSNNKDKQLGQYSSNFEAPGTGNSDGDDDEDSDEEDIGRNLGKGKQDLDFDSDEKDAEDDGANAELISLDNVGTGKKSVPKLRKPK